MKTSEPAPGTTEGRAARRRREAQEVVRNDRGARGIDRSTDRSTRNTPNLKDAQGPRNAHEDFVSSWAGRATRRTWLGVPVPGLRGGAVIGGSVAAVVAVIVGGMLAVQSISGDDPDNLSSEQQLNVTIPTVSETTTAGVTATATPSATPSKKATKKAAPEKTGEPKATSAPSADAPATRRTTSSSTTTKASSSTTKATSSVVTADASVNLVSGRWVQESSHTQDYAASNVTDGSAGTYWEAEEGFPQTLTVDLGSVQKVGRLVLSLPPVSDWNSRTQTIAVQGSRNGSSYSSIKGATGYTFDANNGSNNSVTVSVSASTRYLKLVFSANSGWPNAQLGELEVHSG
ncbi:discoidin domain-containing protein [Kineosporia sp. J2-2]|uniref:Discoidin domain-containing protein n=1 Tax=Kineosporia corallincola TaxID=2835133 RepID=A0ABS5TS68_9ACTN|nr:discoidin domain-containing protein [Kineosporia corallincola]MBT0773619.1 discoidin domain-containing protein [Kineosporia corallincola]